MTDKTSKESNFDHIPSQEELAEIYRQSKKADPSSMEYERVLVRPRLHMVRVSIFILIAIALAALTAFVTYALSKSVLCAVLLGILVIALVLLIFAKRVIIWTVKLYQRLAPAKLRNRCRYEPSCSQYMIMAVEKYGAIKVAVRSLKRWSQCKPPNGGFDIP